MAKKCNKELRSTVTKVPKQMLTNNPAKARVIKSNRRGK